MQLIKLVALVLFFKKKFTYSAKIISTRFWPSKWYYEGLALLITAQKVADESPLHPKKKRRKSFRVLYVTLKRLLDWTGKVLRSFGDLEYIV